MIGSVSASYMYVSSPRLTIAPVQSFVEKIHLLLICNTVERSNNSSQQYIYKQIGCQCIVAIPLIRKDGDDVINNVTCALTGTGSINIHRVCMGNMALNPIKQLKIINKNALVYELTHT